MQKTISQLSTTFVRTIDQATNLVFPPRCLGCDRYLQRTNPAITPSNQLHAADHADHLVACPTCRPTIYRLDGPGCPQCARPRMNFPGKPAAGVDDLCAACLEHPPAFEKAHACFEYEGVIADAIQALKYAQQLHIIRSLTQITRPWMLQELTHITQNHAETGPIYILPVPMHVHDLRQRGFNPAALLLRQITHKTPFKISTNLIHKHRQTLPQAGLSRRERLINLQNAFTASLPSKLDPKTTNATAILFDDVLTTTATTHEVSKTLLNAGFARVIVLVIARAAGTGQLSDFL